MSQELSDLLEMVGITTAFAGSLFSYFSYAFSYRDAMMYFSHTDSARQQSLGKPKFLKILGEDLRNMVNVRRMFRGEFDDKYSWKYWSAYLESSRERENSKYLNYGKIREDI